MKPWNQRPTPARPALTLSAVPLGAELKNLDDLFIHAARQAELALNKTGRLQLTLFVLGSEGPHVLTLAGVAHDRAKDDFSMVAQLLCVAHSATAALMSSEAWVLFAKPGASVDATVRPSQSPDRRELVVLLGEEPSGHRQKFLPILRDGSGEFLRFGEFELPKIDSVAGRFSQFLPSAGPSLREQAIAKTLLKFRGLDIDSHQRMSRGPRFQV